MKLGNKAKGSLGATTPEQDKIAERMAETLQRPDSQFYTIVSADTLPGSCVDGRRPRHQAALSPNTAGGTLSLWAAARLASATEATFTEFLQYFDHYDLPIGGHTDEDATAEKTGCGANDRLADVLNFINQEYEAVADTLDLIEQDAGRETTRRMATQATSIETESPAARLDAMRHAGGEITTLVGQHGELVAVVNKVKGTTLDRFALADEFGSDLAFNVDYWSFVAAARATLNALGGTSTNDQVAQFVTAMMLYNIATTFMLGGPNLRVVIRQ